ncbi:MAG: MATE family efflux transporter [Clostridiales bacterium]|nr:MATE family efflux transporter [Clostridiales bacterium]
MENILGVKPINQLIAKFSIPAIISMMVGALYNMADQIFIGNGVEDIAIGATTIAFPIVTVCIAVALLTGVGGAANYNLESGRGNDSRARHAAGNALFLMCAGGLTIMLAVLLFLAPILRFCGVTDNLLGYSTTYAGITAFGLPFLVLTSGGAHLIRADKSPNYSMACMLSGTILNTILDPLFIFVCKWGIAGAAWATVIGQAVSAFMVAFYFLKRQKMELTWRDLRPVRRRIKRIMALGSASSINQISMLVVQIVMNNQLTGYGALSAYGADIPVTCAGVVAKTGMIFMGISIGISQGCQPVWGFNYGAKNYSRVIETYKKAAVICLSAGVIFFLLFQIFPARIISMFGVKSEAGMIFATRYFRIFMFMTFINGLQPMSSGFFTAIGKARLGIITSVTRHIIFFTPLIIILPLFWGIDGILFAGPIADCAAAVVAIFFALREISRLSRQKLPEQAL